MIGLGASVSSVSYNTKLRSDELVDAFRARVVADGGTLEDSNSLEKDLRALI